MDPELAEAVLLEHFRQPRHRGMCTGAEARSARRDNPLCGDVVSVSFEAGDRSEPCACLLFEGQGCALSQAGASLVLAAAVEKTIGELPAWLAQLIAALEAGDSTEWESEREELGALFFAAAQNPARIQCAVLGAEAVLAALVTE